MVPKDQERRTIEIYDWSLKNAIYFYFSKGNSLSLRDKPR